jgi:hypothetical protein
MHISTPNGLTTGPAGGCATPLCSNAATRVLVCLGDPDVPASFDLRDGAYCVPCMQRKVAPADKVERMREQAMRSGGASLRFDLPLSDSHWRVRPFTAEEAAEMASIRRGELVFTCVKPGMFVWRKPS